MEFISEMDMEFLNETDMESVHRVAVELLNEEPVKMGNDIVKHAFISDETTNINGQVFNIFKNASLWEEWKEKRTELIYSLGIEALMCAITSPYRLLFLENVAPYLSRQDFSIVLGTAYTHGVLSGVSQDDVLRWFANADKEKLMYEPEKNFYNSLPDEVVIYRGQKTDDEIDGISWSIDKNVAQKFAKRIVGGGCLLKAKVYKFDILAYFDRREEAEIIVDHENIFELKFLKK